MAQLNYPQLIAQYLGYGRVSPGDINNLDTQLLMYASFIVDDLISIDEKLRAATADSMALEVGDLKVDYNAHVGHLKSEGSRLLQVLSNLVEVTIKFDKYSGRSGLLGGGTEVRRNVYNVVSYW